MQGAHSAVRRPPDLHGFAVAFVTSVLFIKQPLLAASIVWFHTGFITHYVLSVQLNHLYLQEWRWVVWRRLPISIPSAIILHIHLCKPRLATDVALSLNIVFAYRPNSVWSVCRFLFFCRCQVTWSARSGETGGTTLRLNSILFLLLLITTSCSTATTHHPSAGRGQAPTQRMVRSSSYTQIQYKYLFMISSMAKHLLTNEH